MAISMAFMVATALLQATTFFETAYNAPACEHGGVVVATCAVHEASQFAGSTGPTVEAVRDGNASPVAPAASTGLLVSTSPDRSRPTDLDGADVPPSIYAFYEPVLDEDVLHVEFAVDGSFIRRERWAGFDLGGSTGPTGVLGLPTELDPGPHTVQATVVQRSGRTKVVTASFVVSAPQVGPAVPRVETRSIAGRDLSYPELLGPPTAESINKELSDWLQDRIGIDLAAPDAGTAGQDVFVSLDHRVDLLNQCVFSLTLSGDVIGPLLTEFSFSQSFAFRLDTGEALSLSDLFEPGTNWEQLLEGHVTAAIIANGFDDEVDVSLELATFALRSDAVVLSFERATLLPGAFGAFTVDVPIAALTDVLPTAAADSSDWCWLTSD